MWECENGYYYDVFNKICNVASLNFSNCQSNKYYNLKICVSCRDIYYLSQKGYLCYDNTKEGTFYKCQISNFKGDLCQFCANDYFLGKSDFKCTKVEGCISSINENTCLECDEDYCLNNEGKFILNYDQIKIDKIRYYRCKFLEKNEDK